MKLSFDNIVKKIKKNPGEVIYTGEHLQATSKISFIEYNEENYNEITDMNYFEKVSLNIENNYLIILEGFSDIKYLEKINTFLNLHKLTLEDITNINQRNKHEDYEDYSFFVFKKIINNEKNNSINFSQISFVKKDNFLIVFSEKNFEFIDIIKNRLKEKKSLMKSKGLDYLLYNILDILTDEYFLFLNSIAEKIEEIDENITLNTQPEDLIEIKKLKQLLIYLRKIFLSLRDVYRKLQRGDINFVQENNLIYFRDLYDHIIRLDESLQMLKDTTSNLIEIHVSLISYKLNQIMKVLTIISTIFIPLSFLAGLYGMNFEFMPELTFKYGYFIIIGIMFFVASFMLLIFKIKKWF
jgi:magnesium transporter